MDKKECMDLGLFIKSDKILVSSRKVAEVYGKEHKNVLSKIRGFVKVIPELDGLNFKLVEYEDEKGELRPEYLMDRQGFSILVNKFTGDKALKFTYKYTLAFEQMTKELEKLQTQPQLPTTYKEALVELLKQIEENEKLELENINLNEQIGFLTKSLSEVEARKAINVIVQQYGGRSLTGNYGNAWNIFYRRVYANTNINLTARKNNRNTKSKLDCIDTKEEWQKVFNIAKNLYLEEVGTLDELKLLIGQELNIKFD